MAVCAVLVLAALLALAAVRSREASAHGAVVDPPTRSYSCLNRWPNGVYTDGIQQDPMCYQAFQKSPDAMWNWNGQLRDNLGEANYKTAVPDGHICSAGLDRYAPLDVPGRWQATSKPNSFTLTFRDDARHGGWYETYVTRQGFDVEHDVLKWSDLERVTDRQTFAPGQSNTAASYPGSTISYNVTAPGRSGPHIVFTMWKAGHADQVYYLCSDVNFTGGGGTPTPTTRPTPTTAPPVTTRPGPGTTTTTGPTPPAGPGACSATYRQVSGWPQGFQGEVTVTAGAGGVKGWSVTATFPGGQTVTQAWQSTVSGAGSTATFTNAPWNAAVAAGGSTSFGFLGAGNPGATPTLSCTAR